MEYDERDIEIIRLLSRLKETGSDYPAAMLASRRQRFVKQIAAFGLGAGAALVLRGVAKAAGGSTVPPIAGTILEAALIVAIVAEAGYVAIINREKILDAFRTNLTPPTVEQLSTPPDFAVPPGELPITGPTAVIETVEPTIVTATTTVVSTPTPQVPFIRNTEASVDPTRGPHVNSTPRPHDDNGNHYGQTPRPERTHEPRNDGGGGGNSDPKEDDKKESGGGNGNDHNNKGDTPEPKH